MISSKNHNTLQPGLSLVEAIIALGMLGVLITSMVVVQQSSFNQIVTSSAKLTRIFFLNNLLLDISRAHKENKKVPEKITVQDPETVLIYTEKSVNKNSSLKDFENIAIENIVASWQDGSVKHEEKIIHVRYKPESEQKGETGS